MWKASFAGELDSKIWFQAGMDDCRQLTITLVGLFCANPLAFEFDYATTFAAQVLHTWSISRTRKSHEKFGIWMFSKVILCWRIDWIHCMKIRFLLLGSFVFFYLQSRNSAEIFLFRFTKRLFLFFNLYGGKWFLFVA